MYHPLLNNEVGEPGSHGEGAPQAHLPVSMQMPMAAQQQPVLMQHPLAQQPHMFFSHPQPHQHGQHMQMQMQPFPYPLYPMQMPAGGMSAFPPGTVLYAMPQPAYTQQPMMLAKPADLDSSSAQTPAWPSFVAMQSVPSAAAVPAVRQEAQGLVAGANIPRWRDSDPAPGAAMSPAVFDKRKRILWCFLLLVSMLCVAFSTVAVGSPSSIFSCAPHYPYTRSYVDVRVNFGYFKYCSSISVFDFNYRQTTCTKYSDHLSSSQPLPQLGVVGDSNTKMAQAFAVMAVTSNGLILLGFLMLLRAKRVRAWHISLALLCCFNMISQAVSLGVFVTKTSQLSLSSSNIYGCSASLLMGGIFQIVVASLDVMMLVLTVLLAVNKISFVGIFKKTQVNA